jgi:predicted TIM-barrel fold metal-dependent hydrolase
VTADLRRAAALFLLLVLSRAAAAGTAAEPAAGPTTAVRYYTKADFLRVEKIDAHVHVHGRAERFMAQALADNFRILTINVDYPELPPLREQQLAAISLRERYPGRVAFATTFSVEHFQSPDFRATALQQIEAGLAHGAVGVKMWKNIGMALRDADGGYVMPDDARLEPIMTRLERDHVVLLGHQAEPRNCWLPLAQMTVRSDREYFREHPQYYMYEHPEMPTQAVILAARDRMLAAHPALRFDAVHLASLEWDVDRVADFLDRFPNADVDVAARLVHLEYQSASDRQKVRRFLIHYQDRILYGSDASYGPQEADAAEIAALHADWLQDWRFLVTSDPMHSDDFDTAFRGLRLPRTVVDKIYRRNAERLFAGAWDTPQTH